MKSLIRDIFSTRLILGWQFDKCDRKLEIGHTERNLIITFAFPNKVFQNRLYWGEVKLANGQKGSRM